VTLFSDHFGRILNKSIEIDLLFTSSVTAPMPSKKYDVKLVVPPLPSENAGNSGSVRQAELTDSLGQSSKQSPHSRILRELSNFVGHQGLYTSRDEQILYVKSG
jgi:hypothetical protein